MDTLEACPDCDALVAATRGPTHRYLGASAGCWAVFNEIGARSLMDPAYRAPHQTVVDTYAAQHPGKPGPQAIQSVAGHLISLHAQLEHGVTPEKAVVVLQRALRERGVFHWIEPPSFAGVLNVLHVRTPEDADDYAARVREWAQAVYDAWSPHHAQIAAWYEQHVVAGR